MHRIAVHRVHRDHSVRLQKSVRTRLARSQSMAQGGTPRRVVDMAGMVSGIAAPVGVPMNAASCIDTARLRPSSSFLLPPVAAYRVCRNVT